MRLGFVANAPEPQRIVPCRDCGTPVELSQFAWEMAQKASEYLARKGEPPLEDGELTRCELCGNDWREREYQRTMARHVGIRAIIGKAKQEGRLEAGDRGWLERNDARDVVAMLDARFERLREQRKAKGKREAPEALD
jgi:hypothetical protein